MADLELGLGYDENLRRLTEEASNLNSQASKKLQEMYQPEPFSLSRTAGEGALAILPMLFGYLANGYQGAAAGADVGLKGITSFDARMEQQDKERDQQRKLEYADLAQQAKDKTNLANQMAMGGLREQAADKRLEQQNTLMENRGKALEDYRHQNRMLEIGAKPPARGMGPVDDAQYAELAKTSGRKESELRNFIKTQDDMDRYRRWAKDFNFTRQRAPVATIESRAAKENVLKAVDGLATTVTSKDFSPEVFAKAGLVMDQANQEIAKLDGQGLSPSERVAIANNIIERNISQINPNSPEGEFLSRANIIARNLAVASEKGVLSEPDWQFYKSIFTIGKLETPQTYARRLQYYSNLNKETMKLSREALERAGYTFEMPGDVSPSMAAQGEEEEIPQWFIDQFNAKSKGATNGR